MGGFVNLMERIEYIGKEIVYKEEDGKCPIMDGRLCVCLFCRRKAVAERGPQNYNKIRKQARLYSEFAVKMQ